MYGELYDMIVDRLAGLGFVNVGSSLAERPPLPAVQVHFNDDKEVEKNPGVMRDVTFVVQYTCGPDGEGNVKADDIHASLDLIRTGFAGWQTRTVGIVEPCSVPRISLADHRDHGSTQYLIFLVFRVIPATFTV